MEREEFRIEKIIQELQEAVDLGDAPKRGPFAVFVRKEYLVEAIALLRTHQDNQPNEPLTLEELREMHEPVWVSVPVLKNGGYWCLCNGGTIIPPSCQEFDARNIKDWVFYRRPPKEEM